eukprot:3777063-Alexandrium_andersonii.AAC.1
MAWPAGRQRAGPSSTASTSSACPTQPAPDCLTRSQGKQCSRQAKPGLVGEGVVDATPGRSAEQMQHRRG